jgi:hypothetical protein
VLIYWVKNKEDSSEAGLDVSKEVALEIKAKETNVHMSSPERRTKSLYQDKK